MHFTHLLVLATTAAAIAAPAPEAANDLADVEAQLGQAILVGRSLLDAPHIAHDDDSNAAAAYLSSVFDAAETGNAPVVLERRGRWCGRVGQGCGKVRRSAEAVQDILGAPELQKRVAGRWCGRVGQGCGKAKRSIESILAATEDILGSPEIQKREAGRWCGRVGQGCGKVKRDVEVTEAPELKKREPGRWCGRVGQGC